MHVIEEKAAYNLMLLDLHALAPEEAKDTFCPIRSKMI